MHGWLVVGSVRAVEPDKPTVWAERVTDRAHFELLGTVLTKTQTGPTEADANAGAEHAVPEEKYTLVSEGIPDDFPCQALDRVLVLQVVRIPQPGEGRKKAKKQV
eukprot:CAMPEP_0114151324 /NCGR_PEP_ID=MMETSP0043_2-20121206/23190_1 /TAXON_ID=464988 /ORGANISM="Hemiselmis andersenii, Strain CCMP644" /LENGTH=104 /DNA_ID=CAMNT_0001246143 /DNA_START=102 /DNA_END=413 /DNA_ORIENTATION=-